MSNNYKEHSKEIPIENHQTAAWANITKTKPVSEVPLPNSAAVKSAKDYADENKK
jgi:hypothetical protein